MALALGGAAAVLAFAILLRPYFRRRPSALDLEQKRLAAINAYGKLGDGNLTGVHGATLTYSYRVGGVEYNASQDFMGMEHLLPGDPALLIGPVSIKYYPGNPANSIVICEEWSGLRTQRLQKEKT